MIPVPPSGAAHPPASSVVSAPDGGAQSPVVPTIDLDADGVHHGFLKLPWSRDDSAWGAVMVPVTVVARGNGPTALLTGGNHGDEYEGPIALARLANTLRAEDVRGRVIILPFMNHPAVLAGRRTSPIDGGNLNRSFPGRPDGSITQKIADFVMRELVARADCVLDIHAGGRTLDFLPFAAVHVLADTDLQSRCEAAMRAFDAPWSLRMLELDSVGLFDTVVEGAGKVFVTTELGGGGSATARSVDIATHGIQGFLHHFGIVDNSPPRHGSVLLDMPDGDCYVGCEHAGMLEMCRDLGDTVHNGDLLARVHSITRTGEAAVEYHAGRDGILVARHFPGLIQIGDTLAVLAEEVMA